MPRRQEPIGVILAGGSGRRIGGSKATVQLAGTPLIAYPLRALREALEDVAIIAKADTQLPSLPGVTVWIEPDEPRHPLVGIMQALALAERRAVLICAADLPFVTGELVAELGGADPGRAPAVLAALDGNFRPLLGCYRPVALDLLERMGSGTDRPLRDSIAAIEPATLEVSDPDLLFDVDTPDDLLQAAAMLDVRSPRTPTAPVMPTTQIATDLSLRVDEAGAGRPVLIIHGGGGPMTVMPIAAHVAQTMHAITPTLPGFNGTDRPERIAGVPQLASVLLQYLDRADLDDVLVIGSSIGGWVAAEMAAEHSSRITGLVLVDAVGIDVPGETITDFFALDARGVAEYSFHDSERFYVDPDTQSPEQHEAMQANLATLRAVAGDPYMTDPKLRPRLAGVTVPTLVIWGDSDGIAGPDYGRAYAESFARARFELVPEAGHLPQLEQPERTLALIDTFANESRPSRT